MVTLELTSPGSDVIIVWQALDASSEMDMTCDGMPVPWPSPSPLALHPNRNPHSHPHHQLLTSHLSPLIPHPSPLTLTLARHAVASCAKVGGDA